MKAQDSKLEGPYRAGMPVYFGIVSASADDARSNVQLVAYAAGVGGGEAV